MLIYPVLAGSVDSEGNDELVRIFKTYNSAFSYAMRQASNEAIEMTSDSGRQYMVTTSTVQSDLDNTARVAVHPEDRDAAAADFWWVIQETELLD